MVTLNDKKINHLKDLIEIFYDLDNDAERMESASAIVGILDYILCTDTYELPSPTGNSLR